jgi:adenosine deaminase
MSVPLPLPLSDLHRHLDGSLRPSTLSDLARREGKAVPADLAFTPGVGLQAALSRFAFTLSLLQSPEAVRRVAGDICEDAAAEGVSTLEIRFAPQLHHGAALEAIIDAALEGIAGRAGLILCGLYGEPPDVLHSLLNAAESRPGVVGIDLAGGPLPAHAFTLADYAPAFQRAEQIGIGRTVHAGEGRPAEEIKMAIELLRAQRIGHGTTLLTDPAVRDLVVQRGIVIEACPTSNVHTGVLPSVAAHPLPAWLALGVKACICTDNTLLSGVSSQDEHRNALAIPGMTAAKLQAAVSFGHQGAFRRRELTK